MKSWKTTLGGCLTAAGLILAQQAGPHWLVLIGQILTACGPIILGAAARDNNVSSEVAGIKPQTPPTS